MLHFTSNVLTVANYDMTNVFLFVLLGFIRTMPYIRLNGDHLNLCMSKLTCGCNLRATNELLVDVQEARALVQISILQKELKTHHSRVTSSYEQTLTKSNLKTETYIYHAYHGLQALTKRLSFTMNMRKRQRRLNRPCLDLGHIFRLLPHANND